MPAALQVVWFKRDLRVRDHRPLYEAARVGGPLVALYVYEPEIVCADDFDPSHLVFINQSLAELDARLRALGGRLTTRVGRLPEVFDELHARHGGIARLWSHEETGNALSFTRDKRVASWCREHGVPWTEIAQHGVFRPHPSREGWSARWTARMSEPITPAPAQLSVVSDIDAGRLQTPADLGLPASQRDLAQPGGEAPAHRLLESFLDHRGVDYRRAMSAPGTAWNSCSRLSPYLTFGCLSIRETFQRTRERQREVDELDTAGIPLDGRWRRSLASFQSRLRWHCHFIQKLEDEPALENRNFSRAYDGMREESFDARKFAAWCEGYTGYPLVDACMRALQRSGWINFRMRAMLASFAAYHLWLHWQPTSVHLARLFLDYEPGIHYPQFQMQSGVTGINSVRIYSPTKQALDQDPDGVFIRRFVPELENVPAEFIAEPHRMPGDLQKKYGCLIGRDYPLPIVDHAEAHARAKEMLGAIRQTEFARREAQRVYARHGSRERPLHTRAGIARRRGVPKRKKAAELALATAQGELLLPLMGSK